MKSFIIGLMLYLSTSVVYATQIISVVWPWSVGDSDAQMTRLMMEYINQRQTDLKFVFDNRPGAGASIAAIHVAKTPNSIMAASSAFFVRPNFFEQGVHSIDDFKPLVLICSGPLLVMSGKYTKWEDVPKTQTLTIGLGGPGTTSHLVAELIRTRYPNSIIVPYKSTNEPLIDALGQRIDLAVGFVQAAEQYLDTGKLHALGITGSRSVRSIPSLYSQGFVNADRVTNHHSWLVPKSMPDTQFKLMQTLARESIQSSAMQQEFQKLYCQPKGLIGDDADQWFDSQKLFWKDLSSTAIKNSKQ